jgi:hypothetical protein
VTASQDPDEILQQAIAAICAADPALADSEPKQYMVLLESEWPGEGSTFSVMRSGSMKPWEALGLLRFAQMQQEAEAMLDDHEYEDDDTDT